ncbi:MAG: septum site-determining protein MinD, partial [Faecalibacillus sp.]
IINRVNVEDIEIGRSLTIEDAKEILSLPILGIVYDDHEMIEANNRGRPIYLEKGHLLYHCFQNISLRILGQDKPFTKYKKRSLLSRIFSG